MRSLLLGAMLTAACSGPAADRSAADAQDSIDPAAQPQSEPAASPPEAAASPTEQEGDLPPAWTSARCDIRSADARYAGPCEFRSGKGGDFSVRRDGGAVPLLGTITDVSVTLVTGGAEVSGMTTDGVNSRWGAAKRSADDPACWTGADFEVCAY